MSLTDEERKTLVALELKKARDTYEEIGILTAANRWSAHAAFSLNYIKTGILSKEYGRLYNQLQTMREESDYNCVYDVEPEELLSRIEPAKQLIDEIEQLINS